MASIVHCIYCEATPSPNNPLDPVPGAAWNQNPHASRPHACRDLLACSNRMQRLGMGRRDWGETEQQYLRESLLSLLERRRCREP